MKHRLNRLLSLWLAAALLTTLLPAPALAEEGGGPAPTRTVAAFGALDEGAAALTVPQDTPLEELALPQTLEVTLLTADGSTAPDALGDLVWTPEPDYAGAPGEYLFTASAPGVELGPDAVWPAVTVTVEAAETAPSDYDLAVAAFDDLPAPTAVAGMTDEEKARLSDRLGAASDALRPLDPDELARFTAEHGAELARWRALQDALSGGSDTLANEDQPWLNNSGTGTGDSAESPYLLKSYADLAALAAKVNGGTDYSGKYFKLDTGFPTDEGPLTTPIGQDGSHYFMGHFDGSGKSVALNISVDSNNTYAGLFGCLGQGAVVEHVTTTGAVRGGNSVGGVVGYNYGSTVRNCINQATITGKSNVGGVAGFNAHTVEACYNTGLVTGDSKVGGVVGRNGSGTLSNCLNSGTVSGVSYVAGVAGWNSNGAVENCTNSGEVTAGGTGTDAGKYIGGVVGRNGSISYDSSSIDGTVTGCKNTAKVSGVSRVGGVIGYNCSGAVTGCTNTGDTSVTEGATGDEAGYYIGGVVGRNGYDRSNNTVTSCVNSGTVSGGSRMGGVVGFNSNGTVENCTNSGEVTAGGTGNEVGYYVGGVAGQNGGKVTSTGPITYTSGTVTGCANSGAVSGVSHVAGVTGYNYNGTVTGCINDGDVSAGGSGPSAGTRVGGVVGFNGGDAGTSGTVTKCVNTGKVSGTGSVGGVTGRSYIGTIEHCYNTGAVTGTGQDVGGVIGQNGETFVTSTVQFCYNTGAVKGSTYVGGVVGFNYSKVEHCVSLGLTVTATGKTVGRVGTCDSTNGAATLTANRARGDMAVYKKTSETVDPTSAADGEHGEAVTVGTASLSSVFPVGDGWDAGIWTFPGGALTLGGELPTLTAIAGKQNPVLPRAAERPTAEGGLNSYICANGTPLLLVQGGDETKTVIYIDKGEIGVLDNSVDVIFAPEGMDGTTAGNDLSGWTIYGGRNEGTVTGDCRITMTGGSVSMLYGGGQGGTVTGDTSVTITGGKTVFAGGGGASCQVEGSASVTVTGGTVSLVLRGGDNFDGSVGGNVSISITGGTVDSVYGKGSDSTVAGQITATVGGGAIIGKGANAGLMMNTASYKNGLDRFAIAPKLTGNAGCISVYLRNGFSASDNPVIATGAVADDLAKIKLVGPGAAAVQAYLDGNAIKVKAAHYHDVSVDCGRKAPVLFDKALTAGTTTINASGNYYLAEDVDLGNNCLTVTGTGTVVNLCLNGHTLTAGDGSSKVIWVTKGATLNLCDCQPEAANNTQITDPTNGQTVTVTGGLITGGKRPESGLSDATIRIDGDSADEPCTFRMYGGTVAGNVADDGTVYLVCSNFEFHGGRLAYNTSKEVCVDINMRCRASLSGGSIEHHHSTGRNASAVFHGGDSLTLSGKSVIKGNTGPDGPAADFWLGTNMTIGEGFAPEQKIGITTMYTPTVEAPVAVTGPNDKDYSGYFFSHSDKYLIQNGADNVVQLVVPRYAATVSVKEEAPYYKGDSIFLTAQITDTQESGPVTTGTVQFYRGETALGQPVSHSEGGFSLQVVCEPSQSFPYLNVGENAVKAVYTAADGAKATSPEVTVTVSNQRNGNQYLASKTYPDRLGDGVNDVMVAQFSVANGGGEKGIRADDFVITGTKDGNGFADFRVTRTAATASVLVNAPGTYVFTAKLPDTHEYAATEVAEAVTVLAPHNVEYALTNMGTDGAYRKAVPGKPLSFVLTPSEGYRLPAEIAVTMGGTPLEPGSGYIYQSGAGTVHLPSVTGDVVITAAAVLLAPVITTERLPGGTAQTPYSQTLAATGDLVTWSLAGGSLPDGLRLSNDGTIVGTPNRAGTFQFTVKASNGAEPDATRALTISIARSPGTEYPGYAAALAALKQVHIVTNVTPTLRDVKLPEGWAFVSTPNLDSKLAGSTERPNQGFAVTYTPPDPNYGPVTLSGTDIQFPVSTVKLTATSGLDMKTVAVDGSLTLSGVSLEVIGAALPNDGVYAIGNMVWSSSVPAVATVSGAVSGTDQMTATVTPVKAGVTMVGVAYQDGGMLGYVLVQVTGGTGDAANKAEDIKDIAETLDKLINPTFASDTDKAAVNAVAQVVTALPDETKERLGVEDVRAIDELKTQLGQRDGLTVTVDHVAEVVAPAPSSVKVVGAAIASGVDSGEVVVSVKPTQPEGADAVLELEMGLTVNGAEQEPLAPMFFEIEVPEGIDLSALKLYHVKEDGSKTELPFTKLRGRTIAFKMLSFSSVRFVVPATGPSGGGDTPSGGGTSGGGGSGGGSTVRYTLTATAGSGGGIDPEGKIEVRRGGKQTFTIAPEAGYEIADVLVDGRSVGAVETYTFEKVDRAHTIEASFRAQEGRAAWNPFTDVGAGDWFHDSVRYVYERGLMNGTGGAAFSPYRPATRGMVVTILWRMEGEPESGGAMGFADVTPESLWYEAIRWGTEQGIVTGYHAGAFGPDDVVTRQELAVILHRYAQYKGADVSAAGDLTAFTDRPDFWAEEAMAWAVGEGIVSGKGGGVLDPRGPVTRSQLAAMLARYLQA